MRAVRRLASRATPTAARYLGTGATILDGSRNILSGEAADLRASTKRLPDNLVYNNAHRSDAEALVAEVPVVLVQGKVALCDGGGGALGHPVEYIQLAKAFNQDPVDCPYCGLRYQMDPSWNSHGHH